MAPEFSIHEITIAVNDIDAAANDLSAALGGEVDPVQEFPQEERM